MSVFFLDKKSILKADTKTLNIALFIFIGLFFSYQYVFSVEIKSKKQFYLEQRPEFIIGIPRGFVVTRLGEIIVCDVKEGNFKIFTSRGYADKKFGKKGYGPDEFSSPWLHDYINNKIIFSDTGTKKVYIYEISKAQTWKKRKEIVAVSVTDLKLLDEQRKILYCSFPLSCLKEKKGNNYILFLRSIDKKDIDCLLPFHSQFGSNSRPIDFGKLKKFSPAQLPDFIVLPQWKFCDFDSKYYCLVWTGNLEIIRIKRETGRIDFLKPSSSTYIKPKVNGKLRQAYFERRSRDYRNILRKMSWVIKLFVDNNFIGVIYSNYDESLSRWVFYLQILLKNGQVIFEGKLKGFSSNNYLAYFYYNKAKKLLYGLSDEIVGDKVNYKILIYEISL